jgi:hypothetical protein
MPSKRVGLVAALVCATGVADTCSTTDAVGTVDVAAIIGADTAVDVAAVAGTALTKSLMQKLLLLFI